MKYFANRLTQMKKKTSFTFAFRQQAIKKTRRVEKSEL